MPWIPDQIWYAQRSGKSQGGKSRGRGSGWLPDDIWLLQKLLQGIGGAGKGSGKGSWGKSQSTTSPKTSAAVAGDLPFRARLLHACQQKNIKTVGKDFIIYNTERNDEGQWVSQLICEKFKEIYASEPAVTKKQAEENAAMQAMKGEFATLFKQAPMALKKKAEDVKSRPEEKKKQGCSLQAFRMMDAKGKLNTGLMILVGRSITKGEVNYTVESKGYEMQATVTINCLDDGPKTFKGRPCADAKQAEMAAAAAALKMYQKQIEAMIPEHEARKTAKEAEKQAKRDAMGAEGELPPAKKLKTK
mmetsp:Transcript_53717/g.85495  ORF Transcript_53717/g.85495 Transcript_53717/m.85495 type:complete len:303 (-) Transcript_53717:233-1141(-)